MSRWTHRLITTTLGAFALSLLGIPAGACDEHNAETTRATGSTRAKAGPIGWLVPAAKAKALIQAGAVVLDTRGRFAFMTGHARGAQRVTWQEFSKPKGVRHGELLASDQALTRKLRALGISTRRPVVVVGDPRKGWGEEGRIVWMLRTLGHKRATMVDGGHAALAAAGVAQARGRGTTPKRGDFTARRVQTWSADTAAVRAMMKQPGAVILDTREPREYLGKTPYGERRGGHVPGAKHLYFKELIGPDGKVRDRATLRRKLRALGVKPGTPVVAYCTGGIRSAWVVAVLQDAGFSGAKNYAGSMWAWSGADTTKHPLKKGKTP